MDIQNTRELKSFAGQRLENAREGQKIVLTYTLITIAVSTLVVIVNYFLNHLIDQTSGLGSLGQRSMLSTIQTILPFAQTLFLMCLDLGYLSTMLRVARGQYASPNGLRLGFDRFWVLLRCGFLKGALFFGLCFVSIYAAVMIYLVTPLSQGAMDILVPLVSAAGGEAAITLDDATYSQLVVAMIPAFVICGVLYIAIAAPFFYKYRMADYILIDRPGTGAMAALRESRMMMKGNRVKLLRLDISMWWYYLLLALAAVVCYGDMILSLLGVALPFSESTAYFLFFALYLAATFAIYYFLRNRVEVTYALFYDSVRPKEQSQNSVVLGNIFQM